MKSEELKQLKRRLSYLKTSMRNCRSNMIYWCKAIEMKTIKDRIKVMENTPDTQLKGDKK